MVEVSLTQEKVALIDDEDYELVSQYKWQAHKDGNTFYAYAGVVINNQKTTIKMHRLLMGVTKGQQIDHKNGNGLDNRRENLRVCFSKQNNMNRKTAYGSSKYKGVDWKKDKNKWRATISENRKQLHLGYFSSEKEAAQAYDKAAKKLFGDFAKLNLEENYV